VKTVIPEHVRIQQINDICKDTVYSFVKWVDGFHGCRSDFICHCEKYGDWITNVHRFVRTSKKCKKCADERAYQRNATSEEDWLKKVSDLSRDTPYSFVKWVNGYKNCNSYAIFECKTHCNTWKSKLSHFIFAGSRCPKCGKYGFSAVGQAELYVLKSNCSSYLKIGITSNFERRIKELTKHTPFDFSTMVRIEGDGKDIRDLETSVHRNFTRADLPVFKGSSEWFVNTSLLQQQLNLLTTPSNSCNTVSYFITGLNTMTKERILDVAYSMALSDGFSCLKRDDIAAKAGVALGTVNHHWQSVSILRKAVMERAVENEDLKLIAEGIAAGEAAAQAAPQELRLKALTSLAQ